MEDLILKLLALVDSIVELYLATAIDVDGTETPPGVLARFYRAQGLHQSAELFAIQVTVTVRIKVIEVFAEFFGGDVGHCVVLIISAANLVLNMAGVGRKRKWEWVDGGGS